MYAKGQIWTQIADIMVQYVRVKNYFDPIFKEGQICGFSG